MPKNEIYIIIADKPVDPSLQLGAAIREGTVTATQFKRAYTIALQVGEIHDPRIQYRAALERVTNEYAVQIEDKSGPNKVVIARVKKV